MVAALLRSYARRLFGGVPGVPRVGRGSSRSASNDSNRLFSSGGPSAASCVALGALSGGSMVALYFRQHAGAGLREESCENIGPHSYQRVLYIMRGVPGSGKSTLARRLFKQHVEKSGVFGNIDRIPPLSRTHIISSDDFATAINEDSGQEVYHFDFKRLKANHERNQTHCAVAMELGVTPLIIDNTNTTLWEMRPYVELALEHGYKIEFTDVLQKQSGSIDLDVVKKRCAQRNVPGKNIPDEVLERMWSRFQPLPEAHEEAVALILKAESPFRKPISDSGTQAKL